MPAANHTMTQDQNPFSSTDSQKLKKHFQKPKFGKRKRAAIWKFFGHLSFHSQKPPENTIPTKQDLIIYAFYNPTREKHKKRKEPNTSET